jgi:hypothetical protein
MIRTHSAVLEKQDVSYYCGLISNLCKEAGCKESSELCAKASEVVLESEERYLLLCEQSCKKCGELRRPKEQFSEKSAYVA